MLSEMSSPSNALIFCVTPPHQLVKRHDYTVLNTNTPVARLDLNSPFKAPCAQSDTQQSTLVPIVRVVYHAAQNAKMKLFALVSVVDRLVLHSLLYALVSSLGGRLTPLVGAISCVVDVVSRLSIRSMTFKCYQLDKRNYFIDLRMLLVEKWRRDEHLAWHNRLHL
ncbi:hypothetical protein Tco_0704368 [Tanacetum coccineum]|uniref:Uncharacterized protein n=1 Tax=Tanacetum coccineum TaxID=301880 RepID=A0ABQ4Y2X7_9ASTR